MGQFMDLVDLCVTKPGMGELFGTTAWFIWNHRNKVRLNDRTLPLSRVGEAAKNLMQQVQSVRAGHKGVRRPRRCKWTPSQARDFKANFDGAWFDEYDEAGIGIVIRDSSGQFEGDSEVVIKALKSEDIFCFSFGHIVRDTLVCVNSLRSFSFAHIVRQGNFVAYALAQRTRLSFPLLVWMEDVPSDIDSFVIADFSGS
ncbi:uncharacterized protein LOC142612370 [Castanea sativa]|uniref:uncharacterized protein LOC142612370 n=1 Tax=Castanea sativa TaxID=21020 RepID=UPI003F6511DE